MKSVSGICAASADWLLPKGRLPFQPAGDLVGGNPAPLERRLASERAAAAVLAGREDRAAGEP